MVCKPDSDKIVGHLPIEISIITKFIVDRGAKCILKIRGMHYRRSPLVQGGLAVPWPRQSQDHDSLNHNGKKRKMLIRETFGKCSETQQRKQLTIKKLIYLINKI